ncbi:hypothetical protein [Paenibacillus contaminans]|uniref:Uncharacterized protein n=1 Tax=Paenibacillus contaminans TaxID=450362 RepID=A0A329MR19_9BACL|nr:hypothetical protein [Paenibacillus contaminans]RAV22431.1 hypothetical protein DQG23_05690 [Paenibacillus contaminans]
MSNEWQARLAEAKERKYRLQKAERKRMELLEKRREQERLVTKLEIRLQEEQEDVDKLTRLSLANLFHTILRSKEEQLEMERQQALAAALKLQEARQLLAGLEDDIRKTGDDLGNFSNADREYDRLLAEKESILRDTPTYSEELAELDDKIADQSFLVKELDEAHTAGKRVVASLNAASESLDKAENWGKWDMLGGGAVSTHIKHNHVDDAKQSIHNANRLMMSFRDELEDLKRSVDIRIEISGLLKTADYWFDDLITDWVVQGRIQRSQEQVLGALQQVRTLVNQLQSEYSAAQTRLEGLKRERSMRIEQIDI